MRFVIEGLGIQYPEHVGRIVLLKSKKRKVIKERRPPARENDNIK